MLASLTKFARLGVSTAKESCNGIRIFVSSKNRISCFSPLPIFLYDHYEDQRTQCVPQSRHPPLPGPLGSSNVPLKLYSTLLARYRSGYSAPTSNPKYSKTLSKIGSL